MRLEKEIKKKKKKSLNQVNHSVVFLQDKRVPTQTVDKAITDMS
jgi:hypothetical protein